MSQVCTLVVAGQTGILTGRGFQYNWLENTHATAALADKPCSVVITTSLGSMKTSCATRLPCHAGAVQSSMSDIRINDMHICQNTKKYPYFADNCQVGYGPG